MGKTLCTTTLIWIVCLHFSFCDTKQNNCTIIIDQNKNLVAHCENRGLVSIPSHLNAEINVLDLNYNFIKILKNNSFINYRLLQTLTLDNNRINEIESMAFTGLPSLKRLSMNNNQLNILKLSEPMFQPLHNLNALYISGNRNLPQAGKFTYPDRAFSILSQLRNLSLDMHSQPYFGEGFQKMTNLYMLKFDHCNLNNTDVLSNETFKYFSSSVKVFFLKECHSFFSVQTAVLGPFPFLDILDISDSYIHLSQALRILYPFVNKNMSVINFHSISDLSVDTFAFPYSVVVTKEMMKYLTTICVESLDLSKSGIVDYEVGSLFSFKYPRCIRTFIMSVNRIPLTDFSHVLDVGKFFNSTTNMKVYDFSYLSLDYPNPVFLDVYNPTNIREALSLRKDRQTSKSYNLSIPQSVEFVRIRRVMASHSLSHIICSNSSLKFLDISFGYYVTYPKLSFECAKKLEYLDVSGISSNLLLEQMKEFPLLKTLIMTHAELYRSILTKSKPFLLLAPKLKSIDISFNNLWFLDDDTFKNIPDIVYLNMSNNILRAIPNAVGTLKNLRTLDISHNLITSVGSTFLDFLVTTNGNFTFYLSNNALVCSCDTVDFLQWIGTTKVHLPNSDSYNCSLNGKSAVLRGVAKNMHTLFAGCNSKTWLKIGIIMLACIFGITIPFSVVYSFRWRIIFAIYRKFRTVVEKRLDINYRYDLYVSYEDSSVPWIKHRLIPKVENEWGLQMCLQDRDLLAGEDTADAKAESIEQSRHIMFIVTKDFIENRWSRYEIDRAKYEKYTQNLRKIIVVMRDVGINEIPEQLLIIWKDVCFIEWPGNNNEVTDADGETNADAENRWLKLKLYLFLS